MDSSNKIRKLSTALQVACYCAIAVTLLALWSVGSLYNTAPERVFARYTQDARGMALYFGSLSVFWSLFVAALMLLPKLLGIYGWWHLSKAFSLFGKSLYFTIEAANHLFIFALAATLSQLLEIPSLLAAVMITEEATGSNAPELAINLNFANFVTLIPPIGFVLVSWVIREGAHLRKENEGFV